MRNLFGPNSITGYCTNVHAGATYAQMLANLEAYAVPIRKLVCQHDEMMGVGLWIPHDAAWEIISKGKTDELKAWLHARGLIPFTINGFPYGNFHEARVKHKVYLPDWSSEARLQYTIHLADILARLLDEDDKEGSISTLPIGWRKSIQESPDKSFAAAQHLVKLIDHLAHLEDTTGKLIHIDLEPEPGCYLDTSQDVVDFFKDEIALLTTEYRLKRYLRVCHDVCHAAVMFESQEHALKNYKSAGIEVGKVQISSAVKAPFDKLDIHERMEALEQLRAFGEDRYLHQTVSKIAGGHLWEDLPVALAEFDGTPPPEVEWRTHFHVPLFLREFGLLQSTQAETIECLKLIGKHSECKHFEVETYAWSVLPPELKTADLTEGIAREMQWVRQQMGSPMLMKAEGSRKGIGDRGHGTGDGKPASRGASRG